VIIFIILCIIICVSKISIPLNTTGLLTFC
jgi:hypothetical protein